MDAGPAKPRFADLTLGRATMALLIGGVAGAAITSVGMVVTGMFVGHPDEPQPFLEMIGERLTMIPFAIVFFLPALLIWLAGLFALGAPGWAILHRLRLRSLPVALAYGFILVLAALWLPGPGPGQLARGEDWAPALRGPVPLAVIGTVVAWIVWRFAYRGRLPA